MMPQLKPTKRGECDGKCLQTDVDLYPTHHGMFMCKECRDGEMETIKKIEDATRIIETSRKIDSTIELKQDIWNAETVPFVQLVAAIENNPEIPPGSKNLAIVAECAARLEKLNAIIFEEDAKQVARKNARQALLSNAQDVVAKLQVSERAKYAHLNVNYKPQAPKTPKPRPIKAPAKKFDKTLLFEAAKKYDVPASLIQGFMLRHPDWSYDDAAKHVLSFK